MLPASPPHLTVSFGRGAQLLELILKRIHARLQSHVRRHSLLAHGFDPLVDLFCCPPHILM